VRFCINFGLMPRIDWSDTLQTRVH
jgi:hypothetical protein